MLRAFEDTSIKVAAVSADSREMAETELKEEGWRLPLTCDMSRKQMRELGFCIFDPRSPQKTDRPFAQPATFAINPDGNYAGHRHFKCTVCAVRPRCAAVRVEVHPGKAAPGPGHEGLTP
jgi:peroxiredoxin